MVDAEDPSSDCGVAQKSKDGADSSAASCGSLVQEQRTRQDNTRIATSLDKEQLEGTGIEREEY